MAKKMTKQEFYSKVEEWINHPRERWNHVTVMSYFYYKYKKKNGIEFMPARWSGNPASSKECRDFAKLFKMFADDNYKDLKSEVKKRERLRVYNKIYN